MSDLASMFEAMTLRMMGKLEAANRALSAVPNATPSVPLQSLYNSPTDRQYRCLWYDSLQHLKRSCAELPDAIQSGAVRFNEAFRIVNAITGQELLPMPGRGGMKAFLTSQPST